MRQLAAALLICMIICGCAWSHYENGNGMKCWTLVAGKGTLGADCRKTSAKLASEDTGISDNGILALGAIAEGAARGAKP